MQKSMYPSSHVSQRRALHLAVQQGRGGRAGGGDTDGGRGGPAAGGVAGEHRGPRQPGPGLALHLEAGPHTPVPPQHRAPGHGPQGRTLAGRGGAELQRPGALVPLPRAHPQLRVQRHVSGRGQPLHQARVPGRGAHGLLAGPRPGVRTPAPRRPASGGRAGRSCRWRGCRTPPSPPPPAPPPPASPPGPGT